MLCQSIVAAFGCKARRLIAQHENDFVFYVNFVVIVVAELSSGSAVTGKDHWSVGLSGRRETEWHEILVQLQLRFGIPILHLKMVAGLKLCPGHDRERLKVRLRAGWFQSQRFKTLLDQVSSAGESFSAITPAFHGRRGQGFDVVEVALGISWAGRTEQQRQQRRRRKNSQPENNSRSHEVK